MSQGFIGSSGLGTRSFGLIPPEQVDPKLNKLKPFMDQAGRDFSTLELSALATPPRLNEKEDCVYPAAGVNMLSMLFSSNDY